MTAVGETVILAQGDFPKRDGVAWRLLASARRVVACDGAAIAYRRRFRRWPDKIVGDLDSLPEKCRPKDAATRVVSIADQNTNDLIKALDYARAQGWRNLVIVGATGGRDDHTLGNVFRALERQVPIVTDFGVFRPVLGRATFATAKGAAISVFAPDASTKMTSRGLEWPLDGVAFTSLYVATLNRATAARVTVTSDRPVFIYIAQGTGS